MIICTDMATSSGCRRQLADGLTICPHCGTRLNYPLRLANIGDQVRAYRIVNLIGFGGFGAVYEAQDTRTATPRQVALKATFHPQLIRSFHGEFEILSKLHHENLPEYYEVFEFSDTGYLVMEFVPGNSLDTVLASHNRPLPENTVIGTYALQVCAALEYLHGQPIPVLHRDIKPANIRLTPYGQVKLVDFGLIKLDSERTNVSRRAMTPAYASPEQFGQTGTSVHSDIYSLAATTYHLLTNVKPLMVSDRLSRQLPSPQQLRPDLKPHVSDAIMRGLELRPQDRWQTAVAFRRALFGETAESSDRASHFQQLPPPSPGDGPQLQISENRQPRSPVQRPSPQIDAHRQAFPPNHSQNDLATAPYWADDEATAPAEGFDPVGARKVPTRGGDSADGQQGVRSEGSAAVHPSRQSGYRRKAIDSSFMREFRGHGGRVWSVAIDPAGRILASASADQTIRIWQLGDGRLLRVIKEHTSAATCVAFSANGAVLASGSAEGDIILTSVQLDRDVHRLKNHRKAVRSIAFSPDGQWFATASDDWSVKLWRAGERQYHARFGLFNSHNSAVRSVQFSPDGQLLASASSSDASIKLWQVTTQKHLRTIIGHNDWVKRAVFSPSGKLLATASSDATVRIWRVDDGSDIMELGGFKSSVSDIVYSRDGRRLYASCLDGSISLWDLGRKEILRQWTAHRSPITRLVLSSDGQVLASASHDWTVRLWWVGSQ